MAAGCAAAGLSAALGWPSWPAAPLLLAALLLAIATLAFAVASHHLPHCTAAGGALLVALLLAFDCAVLVGAAAAAGEHPVAALLAVALAASLLLHGRAVVRIAAPRPPRPLAPAPAEDGFAAPASLAALSGAVGHRAREAIGIVRARAEAMRLAAEDAGVGALLAHDLDVLVRHAEECQRALRELEQALEPRLRDAARLSARAAPAEADFRAAPDREAWPSESTPLRS